MAAALENVCVKEFIAEGLSTWSIERVKENPPCFLVYEHVEVCGHINELPAMARHAEKRGNAGAQVGIRPLRPDEEFLAYMYGLRRFPSHPGRRRWEQRMALKKLLPPRDRRAVRAAMDRTQRDFVEWAHKQPGLKARVADATSMTLREFWRAVRGAPPRTTA